MSAASSGSTPGGNGPAGPFGGAGSTRAFQPVRAVAVVLVSVGVAVAVLARMGGVPNAAVASTTSTSTVSNTTTTTSPHTGSTLPSTTTTTSLPAAKVTVLVLNGGSTEHAALYFQTKLSAAGFDTRAPTDATSSNNQLTQVLVMDPAAQGDAVNIAQLIKAPAASVLAPTAADEGAVPTADLQTADVIVVVGANISGQVPHNFNTTTTVAATTTS